MIEYVLSWMIMAAINESGGPIEHDAAFRVAVRALWRLDDPIGWIDSLGEWS